VNSTYGNELSNWLNFQRIKQMVGESDLSPTPFIGHLQIVQEESVKRLKHFTAFETVVALSLPHSSLFLWVMREW